MKHGSCKYPKTVIQSENKQTNAKTQYNPAPKSWHRHPGYQTKLGPLSRQLSLEQTGQINRQRHLRRPRGRDLRRRARPEKRSTERKNQDRGRITTSSTNHQGGNIMAVSHETSTQAWMNLQQYSRFDASHLLVCNQWRPTNDNKLIR